MLSIITTTSIATLALLSPPTQSLSFTSSKSSLSSRWASSFTSSSTVRILSDGYADHAVAVVSPDVAVGREFVMTYGIVCSLAFVLARRDGASDSRLVRCICSLNNESVKKLQLP
eukprot:scaffold1771_cov211-Alexandrium_tamarense.AAC.21